ncbi:hypothetical protein L202_03520 [Cryptococcus amylolentus CBS 6039]|uniref:G-protein coupled receptors family 1 profile domain-containing protein n=2 Tax=Cryptococcus amylolentus TaxID=104669 RepID=A0A1E3HUZ8_9TREE|nr:hypothetical protein L202_03520 [Cryptococcus amylolentus CBS 6039]ODN79566.1 hypothetical protein L202_03520 [Cryptococcus amylolentus CBS 6039]ODO07899.1 hypothetical protein I350_03480 [Cryptococcus amylolentus CBS 6273]
MPGPWAENMVGAGLKAREIYLAEQTGKVEAKKGIIIVNVVILCLTVLGAGMIVTSMTINEFVRGRPGTTRTRIVQALILSDLILGIVGLVAGALTLSGDGHLIAHGTAACSGLGFMLTTVLWSEHLWTLILAFATYMILIYPLHTVTLWLERRWYILWGFVWVLSPMIGLVGYKVYGYYPAGGVCYYGDNTGLYAELIQFIPRAVVCLTVVILYSRLIVFLRRPDKIRAGGSGSTTGYLTQSETAETRRRSRLVSFVNVFRRQSPKYNHSAEEEVKYMTEVQIEPSTPVDSSESRRPSRTTLLPFVGSQPTSPTSTPIPLSDIPPWERIELPPFQVDGEKYGGPQQFTRNSNSMWNGWKGLGGKKRSSASSVASPKQQPKSRFGSMSSTADGSNRKGSGSATGGPTSPTLLPHNPRLQSISASQDSSFSPIYEPVQPVRFSELLLRQQQQETEALSPTQEAPPDQVRKPSSSATMVDNLFPPSRPLSPGTYFPSNTQAWNRTSTPTIDRQRPSVSTVVDDLDSGEASRKSSVPSDEKSQMPLLLQHPNVGHATPGRPLSPVISQASPPSRPQSSGASSSNQSQIPTLQTEPRVMPLEGRQTTSSQAEMGTKSSTSGAGTGMEDGDEEMDLLKMLAGPPPAHMVDRFAPPTQSHPGEQYELVPESMSSYLNRKTALLMLWFPLGYVILFSVSFVRLIYDFAGDPPTALRAISRWFVLSQGLLDAIIYGFVEWHTKRVVRRRVRRGTFSPHETGSYSANGMKMVGNAARAVQGLAGRMTGQGSSGGKNGTGSKRGGLAGSQQGTALGSQTGRVSFTGLQSQASGQYEGQRGTRSGLGLTSHHEEEMSMEEQERGP